MTVGSDVSFGTGAVVVGPVTIGDHVVVGAGSVVVDDVPNNVTVAGVPARVVGTRETAMPWLRNTGSDSG
jgi:serine O-acetyltransferase